MRTKSKSISYLLALGRIILRSLYGPTKHIHGTWMIKTNKELGNLTEHKNIIHFIKTQRLRWLGQVERVPEERDVKEIYK
jgi:hypothetical protein